jgi:pre-mRNA-splicing factor ATP-dependent RNA helicase DHX38/PRP16
LHLTFKAIDQAALDVAKDLEPSTNSQHDPQDDSHAARKDSQFASHLKKSEGVSHFAKTKSLKQQRQYLPAFACRERLLKQIRENQGKYAYLNTIQTVAF